MLYDRWRQVAEARRGERALREAVSGRIWTFAELDALGDTSPPPRSGVVFPRGYGIEFVREVLRGWRHNALVCPLEIGQEVPPFPTPPSGTAQVKLTSATTGSARLVLFTGDQLAADAANIVATMGLRPDWPNLAAISLAHSYGFSNLILPLLLHGIPLILAGSSLPEAVRRAAEGEDALTLAGVPALWRAWHEAEALSPALRLGISAGAPLPSPLELEVFRNRGLKIHNFYGSSECGGIAYDRTSAPRTDSALAGTAMENVRLQVAADGCLEVRGPNVGTGYWPEPASELESGVFRTRDLVELRGDDVLMRGRAGDVVHVAGRKVAPEDIERVLLKHPLIRECLVLGVPALGEERGETIAAVVAAPGLSSEELRGFATRVLPPWQVPRLWHRVEELSVSERGKISRAAWRDRLLRSWGAGQAGLNS